VERFGSNWFNLTGILFIDNRTHPVKLWADSSTSDTMFYSQKYAIISIGYKAYKGKTISFKIGLVKHF
jgi:hypothetical protein